MKHTVFAAALFLCLGSGQTSAAPRCTVVPLQLLPGTEAEDTAHCELRPL